MAIGYPILAFDILESTNKTAAELLRLSKVQHGAVILAHEQTGGRGQRGRSWISRAGLDLTMSVVLQPTDLRAEEQFALSKVVALAVRDAVQELVPAPVRVKWPNDILVDRRKLAGILIENELVGDRVVNSVVGIGLNVNSTEYPEELVASSLRLETGSDQDVARLMALVCARMEAWWCRWSGAPAEVDLAYAEHLWARGRWAQMHLDQVECAARPMDVDRHGRLIVEMEGGGVAAYGLDRLRFVAR